ncbi:MAG: polyribonucleotide nucleotidyltransferase, partial [Spartobacteria bacterium]
MSHTSSAQAGKTPIVFESGKLAKLADGAVTVRSGDTVVIVTAVSATTIKEGQDFFPLTVEYKEKAAAVGKFPGGYFKREGRPSEKEILTARMTDRPLRPLFPKGYLYDTQIITLLLSADGQNDPDILSINGASAALCVSDIPFAGPVGAVRVGRINGQFVINPTHDEREHSDFDLVYVGDGEKVIMIEGAANELPEAEFNAGLDFAREAVKLLVAAQRELAAAVGKVKRSVPLFQVDASILEVAYSVAGDRIEAALYTSGKVNRSKAVGALREEVEKAVLEKFPSASKFEISQAFDYLQKKAFRISILDRKQRCDGRGLHDIRALSGDVGLLPRTHGSALFARGETQALGIATLAPAEEAQMIDSYGGGPDTKRF